MSCRTRTENWAAPLSPYVYKPVARNIAEKYLYTIPKLHKYLEDSEEIVTRKYIKTYFLTVISLNFTNSTLIYNNNVPVNWN